MHDAEPEASSPPPVIPVEAAPEMPPLEAALPAGRPLTAVAASATGHALSAGAGALASGATAAAKASAQWLAEYGPIAGRWLSTNIPAAARWLVRVLRSAAASARESIACWWQAARGNGDTLATPRAYVDAPVVPLPEEEAAVVARLKAGSNGYRSGIEEFPMRAWLTLIHDPSGERGFEIDRSPLLIGADGHSDIPLPGMAAHEARLIYREGQFILFSLTDVRGIDLNGEAVAWAVLGDGVEVGVGPYTLRFHVAPK